MVSYINKNKPTVFVGVSGGVDSSVAALRLKKSGKYNVVGVFMHTWQPPWLVCNWRDERRSAMRVCAHLDIPFLEADVIDAYKKGVADYMISEYAAGRTPNPDVMCNRQVKFGAFLDWAKFHGASMVATGHYAQADHGGQQSGLLRGIDNSKDQSYFLSLVSQRQLQYIIFPIGNTLKKDLRKEALKAKLPTANKPDSQGVCFLGEIDMKEFLKHEIETSSGNVLNKNGEVVGEHEGSILYTMGQRHGFEIANQHKSEKPLVVIAKDIQNNTITVGEKAAQNNSQDQKTTLVLSQINQIKKWSEFNIKNLHVQVRYHGKRYGVSFLNIQNKESATVAIIAPQSDCVIGQVCAVYANNNECLGAGIIDSTS